MTTTARIERSYSVLEEIFNSSIHGFGILFGIASLAILAALSSVYGNAWTIVSTVIFSTSIILLYTASTIYHAISNPKAKKILKKFDHISIYYLIAGSYTPFLLINLRGSTGWVIFGVIWFLAFLGTVLKLTLSSSGTKLWSIALYLCMGWLIVFATKPLLSNINLSGLVFLILGGLFYTGGIVFYVWKSKKYTHAVWHFFVLTGTIMHFFAILFGYVLI